MARGSAATATSRWGPTSTRCGSIAVARGHRAVPGRPRSGPTARRSSPRRGRSCARQLERLAERGLEAFAATELEFIVFQRHLRARRAHKGYRDLEPANLYNVDYSMLGTSRVEPLIRRIRNEMAGAGLTVEDSKGECNLGQHEINFRYGPALQHRRRALDLQERRQGDRRPGGHGDHVHGQVRRARGQLVPHPPLAAAARTARRCSPTTRRRSTRFVAGQLACLRELTLFYAPNVNSYKRFADGLVRADRGRLGRATTARARCAWSATAPARRIELRAAGRRRQPVPRARGDDRRRACTGSTPSSSSSRRARATPTRPTSRACRRRCARRATCSRDSAVAREAFGEEVVDHYLNNARVELDGVRGGRHRLGAPAGVRAAVIGRARTRVFAPVRSQTAFEETLERLGTAIKLGLLEPGDAAAGRARAVRAARDRALDAAPGADRARAERPPARGARPRRRHVRRRPRRRPRRAALAASCSPAGATPATCGSRSSSASPCSPPSAREPEALAPLDELVDAMDGAARRLPRLPPGRRALPHRPRRGDRRAARWWRR